MENFKADSKTLSKWAQQKVSNFGQFLPKYELRDLLVRWKKGQLGQHTQEFPFEKSPVHRRSRKSRVQQRR